MPTRYNKEFEQKACSNLSGQRRISAARLAREYGIGYSTVHKSIQGFKPKLNPVNRQTKNVKQCTQLAT
ncbi:hypothetical protein [Limosilactobacillus fermentum]